MTEAYLSKPRPNDFCDHVRREGYREVKSEVLLRTLVIDIQIQRLCPRRQIDLVPEELQHFRACSMPFGR